jgi:hypothetical protein
MDEESTRGMVFPPGKYQLMEAELDRENKFLEKSSER